MSPTASGSAAKILRVMMKCPLRASSSARGTFLAHPPRLYRFGAVSPKPVQREADRGRKAFPCQLRFICSPLAACRSGIAAPDPLGRRRGFGRRRLILRALRVVHGVREIGRDPGRKSARRLSKQPLELDMGAPLELFLLQ